MANLYSMFISFEGGEGTGKSTQIKLLEESLKKKSYDVFVTREPGGSIGAETIRNLLVKGKPNRWDVETETLLMYAARRDNYIRCIKPALKSGKIVISDRFADSTRVYQGYVGGVSQKYIDYIHEVSLGDFKPDLTILLDQGVDKGLSRAITRNSNENRFELKGKNFHLLVRKSYLKLASIEPDRFSIIDASGSVGEVKNQIFDIINNILKNKN